MLYLFEDKAEIKKIVSIPQENPYVLSLDGTANTCAKPSEPIYFGRSFTIEFLVNFSSLYNWGDPFGFENRITFVTYGNGTLTFSTGAGWLTSISSPAGALVTNQWYHVAGTYDGKDVKLYLDGQLIGTKPMNYDMGSCIPFIGARNSGNGGVSYQLKGSMDEVRVWNRPLSQVELVENMYTKLSGNEQGLVHYWRIDEGTGQTVVNSGSGETLLTLSGNVKWTNATPQLYTRELSVIGSSPVTEEMFRVDGMTASEFSRYSRKFIWEKDMKILSFNGDANDPYDKKIQIGATPIPRMVKAVGDLPIPRYALVRNIALTSTDEKNVGRIIASFDKGKTWKTIKRAPNIGPLERSNMTITQNTGNASSMFNGIPTDQWAPGRTGWMQWTFNNGPRKIVTYALEDARGSGNNYYSVTTASRLYGLNETTGEWDILDDRTDIVNAREKRYWDVAKPGMYSTYKFEIVSSSGSGEVFLGELELYEAFDEWVDIDINDTNAIREKGITFTEFNSIPHSTWDRIKQSSDYLRFAYYLEDDAYTDKLTVTADLVGQWEECTHGTDFTYGYPWNDVIQVRLMTNGDFKINY